MPVNKMQTRNTMMTKGLLVGVVLDLSGSMRASIKNSNSGRASRIEEYAKTFRQVLEDYGVLLDMAAPEQQRTVRLFIQGFGFADREDQTWQSSIGDVLTVFTAFEKETARYRPLQTELEQLWLEEIKNLIRETRIKGDAEQSLQDAIEEELEKGLNTTYSANIPGFSMVAVWKRLLQHLRSNVVEYIKETQADKVVRATHAAFHMYAEEIMRIIRDGMIRFIDQEAFIFIRRYDAGESEEQRRAEFNKRALRRIYSDVSTRVLDLMKPHIGSVWQKSESTRFLKKAASVLQIEPDYQRLKEKTEECARQIIWEIVKPRVDNAAKELARERFRRAVLVTYTQKVKDQESTFSLQEILEFFKQHDTIDVVRGELPIFGISPLGYALAQTFVRLRKEIEQPQNEGLRPVIVLISDGMLTDREETKPVVLAESIKQAGIPIICGFIMDENIGNSRILHGPLRWFWSKAMYVLRVLAIATCKTMVVESSIEKKRVVEERRQTVPWWFRLALFISRCMSMGKLWQAICTLCTAAAWIDMWRAMRARLQIVGIVLSVPLLKNKRTMIGKYLHSVRWPRRFIPLIEDVSDARLRLKAADLMYSLASSVDESPEIGDQFREGLYVDPHARFFVHVNHTKNLQGLIDGVLKPVAEEQGRK